MFFNMDIYYLKHTDAKSSVSARVVTLLLLLSNRELPTTDAVSRPTASRCRSECSEPIRLRNNKNWRTRTHRYYIIYYGYNRRRRRRLLHSPSARGCDLCPDDFRFRLSLRSDLAPPAKTCDRLVTHQQRAYKNNNFFASTVCIL